MFFVVETSTKKTVVSNFDLTGKWKCDDGIYQLRQAGNELFWYGKQVNMAWAHVTYGTIDGSTIYARWADLHSTRSGNLTIIVDNDSHFRTTAATGGFGCSRWTHV
jgi:hypothetical protein